MGSHCHAGHSVANQATKEAGNRAGKVLMKWAALLQIWSYVQTNSFVMKSIISVVIICLLSAHPQQQLDVHKQRGTSFVIMKVSLQVCLQRLNVELPCIIIIHNHIVSIMRLLPLRSSIMILIVFVIHFSLSFSEGNLCNVFCQHWTVCISWV